MVEEFWRPQTVLAVQVRNHLVRLHRIPLWRKPCFHLWLELVQHVQLLQLPLLLHHVSLHVSQGNTRRLPAQRHLRFPREIPEQFEFLLRFRQLIVHSFFLLLPPLLLHQDFLAPCASRHRLLPFFLAFSPWLLPVLLHLLLLAPFPLAVAVELLNLLHQSFQKDLVLFGEFPVFLLREHAQHLLDFWIRQTLPWAISLAASFFTLSLTLLSGSQIDRILVMRVGLKGLMLLLFLNSATYWFTRRRALRSEE